MHEIETNLALPSFEGRVVVVTGANSGIAETAAVLFAAAGAHVFGIARRPEAIEAKRQEHPEIHWLLADVTDSRSTEAAIASVVRETARLDVLVNNAAVFTFGPLEGSDDAMVRRQFETNVYGPIFASRAAPGELKASRGSILNIGSAAGHKAVAGAAVYGATKAAVESLTRSWALELAPFGVRVNALAPGPTETPGFEKDGATPEQVAATKAAFTRQVPLARMATTSEIGRWILLISDPAVTWITGHVFAVDGGMSLT